MPPEHNGAHRARRPRHFAYLFDTDFREIDKCLILLARPTGIEPVFPP
jgi:hypothetical protein